MEHYIQDPIVSNDIEADPFEANINRLYIFEESISSYVNECLRVFSPGNPIVVVAEGKFSGKAVSCAEIVKSRLTKNVIHQITCATYAKTVEKYVPLPDSVHDLESINVTRTVPVLHILLSYEQLDSTAAGYQKTVGDGGKYGMRKLPANLAATS